MPGRLSTFRRRRPSLVVCAHADARVRVGPRGTDAASEALARSLGAALRHAKSEMRPLFGASDEALRRAGLVDLARYYAVAVGDERSPADVVEALLATEAVEAAYVQPPAELPVRVPAPAELPTPSPEPVAERRDFRARQGYLDAAPGGIEAERAWRLPGGGGLGVGIVDVEAGWNFAHEDLLRNQGGIVAGFAPDDVELRNHGTSVAGVLSADRNAFGVLGVCPDAHLKAVSIYWPQERLARSVRVAADLARPGDIVLLELHVPGPAVDPAADPADTHGYLPAEWWPDVAAAVRYACGRGVIVVAPAGNGYADLDDPRYDHAEEVLGAFPGDWSNPLARGAGDTGSILVGAGAPPPGTHGRCYGPDRSRLAFSNAGSCVDAQGWGRQVTTTGGVAAGPDALQGGPDEDRWYTDRFSGTSSAAPIVAGALACVQGVLRARGQAPLSPAEARRALRETGSPQVPSGGPGDGPIGRRPALGGLIAWASEHRPRSHPTTPRRQGMKLTITITYEDGQLTVEQEQEGAGGPHAAGPHAAGPQAAGPHAAGPQAPEAPGPE
jgi:hypothetical protein